MKSFTTVAFVLSNLAFLVAGQGTNFITESCTSDAECASGCCGFVSGLCSGAIIAQQRASTGGCGFGTAQPNNNAALALGSTLAASGVPNAPASVTSAAVSAATSTATTASTSSSEDNAAGSENVGNGKGLQFITGQCLDNADCASACCVSGGGGTCSAVAVAAAKGGCGFVANSTATTTAARKRTFRA